MRLDAGNAEKNTVRPGQSGEPWFAVTLDTLLAQGCPGGRKGSVCGQWGNQGRRSDWQRARTACGYTDLRAVSRGNRARLQPRARQRPPNGSTGPALAVLLTYTQSMFALARVHLTAQAFAPMKRNSLPRSYRIGACRLSVATLAAAVYAVGQSLKRNFAKADLREDPSDPDGFAGTDARLQVRGGSWQLHTGDSSYDQDHRGAWGSSCIAWGCTRAEARETARELLEDCADCHAMTEGEADESAQ